ncbi:MAG TPA: DUF72 domain-containing protein [Candidatus Acidoferrales bacterium]|nr:DUF72 domain-containing protein [Candidatus Acidoferrales bacterium]
MSEPAAIRLGTSAFTAAGWEGAFYPAGLKPADFLGYYAQQFDTVEVDSTFYRIPSPATVRGWYAKTPPHFLFAAKVPQSITHENVLVNCADEFRKFLVTMEILGEKLGPLLFQFPYFNRAKFKSGGEFLARLKPFLEALPQGHRFAVELRNKYWLDARLADTLRQRRVALALVDHPWLPRPAELFKRFDPITADFAYIRWLGDRKGIEERTKTWDKTIVDRGSELREWTSVVYKINGRGVPVFAYANNHYAGHAPATLRLFQQLFEQSRLA